MRTIQQLNTQLRERSQEMADRLREKDEILRQLREELETRLQQKEVELQQRNADISRLQRQLQVCMENIIFYDFLYDAMLRMIIIIIMIHIIILPCYLIDFAGVIRESKTTVWC